MRIGAHLHRQRDNDALRPAPSRPAALMSRFIGSTCSQRRVSGGSAGAAQVQAAAAEAGQQPSPRPAASIDERACLLILRKVITQANEATVASVLSRQSQRDGTAATSGAAGAAPAAAATAVLPLVLAYDERMLMHSSFVEPHLEGPENLTTIMTALQEAGVLARCAVVPGTPATDEQLLACHSRQMIDTLEAACSAKSAEQLPDPANIAELFGPEALCNEHTAVCARLAAGTAADVACRVARGETAAGVALVRPPGSQAGPTSSSGGSYYNNVAVAARAAQLQGAQRVLVLDFGLHHGAGTQAIFEPDASVLYISLHNASQDDAYPGGGDADEVGSDEGEGMTVNLAWKAGGVVDGDYLAAMQHVVLPIAYEFGPDLIIISGGFDATLPPIAGGCGVGAATYAHMVALTRAVAPVVLVLEDAGEVSPTAEAALACVRVLLGEAPPRLAPGGAATSETGRAAFLNALHIHSMYHKSVNPISLKGWLSVMQQQVAAQQTTEEEQGDDGADDVGNGSLQP